MQPLSATDASEPGLATRTRVLFEERRKRLHCRTDRNFAILLFCQWVAALCFTLLVSPRTWSGESSVLHPHVWLVLIFGGSITALPVALASSQPGWVGTRHIIAGSQALISALLIHISGGRIETHFHVFGSLAFLAFYRDWRVLVTASLVVATDHFLRGIYWPHSIFGVLASGPWRWLEHVGWVLFEDVFLVISIRQILAEMLGVAERQAKLETVNCEIERQVAERSAELEKTHRQLHDASRQAGMAEVATSVLHNVGNVLNSVNTSVSVATEKVTQLQAAGLDRVAAILNEHAGDLPAFFAENPQGVRLPKFLTQLAEHLASGQQAVLDELASLRGNIEHINEIVAMQQSYAGAGGVMEVLSLTDVIDDALRMNAAAFERHGSQLVRELDPSLPPMPVDRNKLLLILVNLIRNAKYACDDGGSAAKLITVRTQIDGARCVKISVSDSGVGIPAENLSRIFEHGFTTRKAGHGFGLHSSAIAASQMGGSLHAHSDGHGRGATFTIELPLPSENL